MRSWRCSFCSKKSNVEVKCRVTLLLARKVRYRLISKEKFYYKLGDAYEDYENFRGDLMRV